jgi:hypothetical protein
MTSIIQHPYLSFAVFVAILFIIALIVAIVRDITKSVKGRPGRISRTGSLLMLIGCVLLLNACATPLTPTQQTAIGTTLAAVDNLVQNYAADGQLNYAQAIPVALDSLAIFNPSTSVAVSSLTPAIASAVSAFTNGSAKTTGQKIAAAVTAGLPAVITGLQANQLLASAGVHASNGAQAVATAAANP